jgi:hypothetical protein
MSVTDELGEEGFGDATFILGSVVYALILNDEVMYIGRTENIITRVLTNHRGQRKIPFNKLWVKSVPRDLAVSEEAWLIEKFKPPYNTAGVRFIKRMTRAQIRAEANRILIETGFRREPLRRRA